MFGNSTYERLFRGTPRIGHVPDRLSFRRIAVHSKEA